MDGLRSSVAAISILVATFVSIWGIRATNHTVGGSGGWALASNVQTWPLGITFHAGDFLVFEYGPIHDVLEIDEQQYNTCWITHPLASYMDGRTVVILDSPGARFFSCGSPGHCQKGMKMRVDVVAPGEEKKGNGTEGGSTMPPPPLVGGHRPGTGHDPVMNGDPTTNYSGNARARAFCAEVSALLVSLLLMTI